MKRGVLIALIFLAVLVLVVFLFVVKGGITGDSVLGFATLDDKPGFFESFLKKIQKGRIEEGILTDKEPSGRIAMSAPADAVIINNSAIFEEDTENWHAFYVNFAPGDGKTIDINPPRFRWMHTFTDIDGIVNEQCTNYNYTFQIATDPDFNNIVVNIQNIKNNNFYNFLSPLDNGQTYYWRIGYLNIYNESNYYGDFNWSQVMSFTIAPDAVIWDRSMFNSANVGNINLVDNPHPRIFFKPELINEIKANINEPEYTVVKTKVDGIISNADNYMQTVWYQNMMNWPDDDVPLHYDDRPSAVAITQSLAFVTFAYLWTGNESYSNVKERIIKVAKYPPFSAFSPEGLANTSGYDGDGVEYWLGLMYDWLYNEFNETEREIIEYSLEWKIRGTLCKVYGRNWLCKDEPRRSYIIYGEPELPCMAAMSKVLESHTVSDSTGLIPAYIAMIDKSDFIKEKFAYEMGFFIAVGHFGYETMTQGHGYSLLRLGDDYAHAPLFLESAFPEFEIEKHPYPSIAMEFLARTLPIGVTKPPWGNCGEGQHVRRDEYGNYFSLPGDIRGYAQVAKVQSQITGYKTMQDMIPEIYNLTDPPTEPIYSNFLRHIFYPFLFPDEPTKEFDPDPVKLYKSWGLTATSEYPFTKSTFMNGTGINFMCRARGAQSHSSGNDMTYKIWAYGQEINMPGGSCSGDMRGGQSAYSHNIVAGNTIFVHGAHQPNGGMTEEKYECQMYAFEQGEDYVYAAGDGKNIYCNGAGCYPGISKYLAGHLMDQRRHVLFVKDKYFVIFDNIRADHPLRYTWLYHVFYDHDFEFDNETMRGRYMIGEVPVHVVHINKPELLEFMDLINATALTNPYTGQKYVDSLEYRYEEEHLFPIHNLWISNKNLSNEFYYYTIVYPTRPGEEEPVITQMDELTARIENNDGSVDVISFSAEPPADTTIWVDLMSLDGFIANYSVNNTASICTDGDEDGYGYEWGQHNMYGHKNRINGCEFNGQDCDDTSNTINPGAPEILDGVDNDCDGLIDEGTAQPTKISIEAENMDMTGTDLEIGVDLLEASGGAYMYAPSGLYKINSFDMNLINVSDINFSIEEPQQDYYTVWGRIQMTHVMTNNNFFIIDPPASTWDVVGWGPYPDPDWRWAKVYQWTPGDYYPYLAEGEHTLFLQRSESGLWKIDKFIITNNESYIPSDEMDFVQANISCVDEDEDGFGDDVEGHYGIGNGCMNNGADCDDRPDGADGIPDNEDDGENIYPGAIEYCNGIDNNCNGVANDNCIKNCADGIDNDGDGLIDCEDSNCEGLPCEDGLACSALSLCQNFQCVQVEQIECDDNVDCTIGTCDEVIGCIHTPNNALCPPSHICDAVNGCIYDPTCENFQGTFIPNQGEDFVAIEAEHYCNLQNSPDPPGKNWTAVDFPGAVVQAMQVLPNHNNGSSNFAEAARLTYKFKVDTTGEYFANLRWYADSVYDNQLYIGLNGIRQGSHYANYFPCCDYYDKWLWIENRSLGNLVADSLYEFDIVRTEDGVLVDRIYIGMDQIDINGVGANVGDINATAESPVEVVVNPPLYSNFDGSTTDFALVPDIGNVADAILENTTYGKIDFSGNVINFAGLDLDSYVTMSQGAIGVDTNGQNINRLDVPATLWFYNIDFTDPVVKKDGGSCDNCTEVSYENNVFIVDVPGFSEYTVVEGYVPNGGGNGGGGGGGGGGGSATYQCNDRIDNDGDGLIDYPNDLGCVRGTDNSEEDDACDASWDCTDYGECVNGTQSRTCVDVSGCNVTDGMPGLTRECEPVVPGDGDGGSGDEDIIPGVKKRISGRVLLAIGIALVAAAVLVAAFILIRRKLAIAKKQGELVQDNSELR